MTSSRFRTWSQKFKSGTGVAIHHVRKHVGVGLVCSIAYFDPGNWGVDLQAGSLFGYHLLFVVLVSGIIAVFLQVLASRLGCVTGLDLASHCRLLLHSHPRHPKLVRWLALYPLYALTEVAIISTDLAELLGSAMALCMLFPKLQLWHGILITAGDVLFLLALKDPLRGRPVRMFEVAMAFLVLAVLICMCIVISRVDVQWNHAFLGFLPSKNAFSNSAFYTSIGILGATVMPHSLFLGSALATQDRDSLPPSVEESRITLFSSSAIFVKRHLYHGIVDMVGSLLGFAVVINSIILIVSGAVFFYGSGAGQEGSVAGLFDAYDLIEVHVGKGAATLFAVSLLAAGQSSSVIATIAGQAVAEGFLRWQVSPVVRRLFTRIIAVVPSMAVAIALGRPGINTLLVVSQVILSIVLPFVMLPLIYLTTLKKFMAVKRVHTTGVQNESSPVTTAGPGIDAEALGVSKVEMVDYSNSLLITIIVCTIWLLVVTADVYVIVTLARGGGLVLGGDRAYDLRYCHRPLTG
ncbi:smf Mn2+ and Fe2+ transporter [Rhodocollybia butyracea]|uniref:Smf Mn2+ and Fe2+ transporter n=1 Tax=Rhodocollybia butyracea TaxID=206335 RepID=A0A9P5PH67_9AGAR|nr:smf Mn2+ and Fe2+ transporter [Rhodocollybia butyracea]